PPFSESQRQDCRAPLQALPSGFPPAAPPVCLATPADRQCRASPKTRGTPWPSTSHFAASSPTVRRRSWPIPFASDLHSWQRFPASLSDLTRMELARTVCELLGWRRSWPIPFASELHRWQRFLSSLS